MAACQTKQTFGRSDFDGAAQVGFVSAMRHPHFLVAKTQRGCKVHSRRLLLSASRRVPDSQTRGGTVYRPDGSGRVFRSASISAISARRGNETDVPPSNDCMDAPIDLNKAESNEYADK